MEVRVEAGGRPNRKTRKTKQAVSVSGHKLCTHVHTRYMCAHLVDGGLELLGHVAGGVLDVLDLA